MSGEKSVSGLGLQSCQPEGLSRFRDDQRKPDREKVASSEESWEKEMSREKKTSRPTDNNMKGCLQRWSKPGQEKMAASDKDVGRTERSKTKNPKSWRSQRPGQPGGQACPGSTCVYVMWIALTILCISDFCFNGFNSCHTKLRLPFTWDSPCPAGDWMWFSGADEVWCIEWCSLESRTLSNLEPLLSPALGDGAAE